MRKSCFLILFVAITVFLEVNAQDSISRINFLQNRAPLKPNPYVQLPFGTIKPLGWLQTQLLKMKTGMTGHLDKLYPTVLGSRNGWLGGDGDVWERGPYWIDGLVPLAYILNDDELKNKLKPWIEWSINNQQADGYFGPVPPAQEPADEPGLQRGLARDWWPKMVMLKALQQYYMATEDKRVISLMLKYFKYQLKTLPQTPLGHYSWWGAQRGADNLLVVYWLYNLTGENFLLDLAHIIHKQTFDWTNNFLYSGDLYGTYKFHGVNLAQGIKSPVIYYQQDNKQEYINAVKKALHDIKMYHGQVQGMYGADEFMRGRDPVQGSEFCTAVELMYSLENMITITGDVNMIDHLERIAYNALPTQATDDFSGKQYYQQANQVCISRLERNFYNSHDGTDNCYGVLTGYPCCATNMHQGWPKLVQNLWLATEDKGIAALVYAPSELNAKLPGGATINFKEETDYPFSDVIKFTYNSAANIVFPFHLRIPQWCEAAEIKINGEPWMKPKAGEIVKVIRKWKKNDVIELKLPMQLKTSLWFNNSVGIERGPLVYALKVEEDWKKVKNEKDPGTYGDYYWEVYPKTGWNYALWSQGLSDLQKNFEIVTVKKPGNEPWNLQNAPVIIKAKGKKVPNWKMYNGDAGPLPYSTLPYTTNEKVEDITLVPYGCTTLRISQFPVAN